MSVDGYFSRSMSLILKCVIYLYKDKVIIAVEKEEKRIKENKFLLWFIVVTQLDRKWKAFVRFEIRGWSPL